MVSRASWKGHLQIGEFACPVALYAAATMSDRVDLHNINRATGHRASRQYSDSVTGKTVEKSDQLKAYAVGDDDYVVLEPEEIAAATPQSDKILAVTGFIACRDIDDLYFARPYYLVPVDRAADAPFALIRDAMRARKSVALTQTILFRRLRRILIRPHGNGLIATILRFNYEVRDAGEAFAAVKQGKIEKDMLDLARHIIENKMGVIDPADFDDRYEAALADLVKAKLAGRKITPPKRQKTEKIVDLRAALRESAGLEPNAPRKSAGRKKAG